MPHQTKAVIPAAVQRRIDQLPYVEKHGLKIVENFGIFIDTHRDQPHIQGFHADIHRGQCVPILVDYIIGDDYLRDPVVGDIILRHDKHLFITEEEWGQFLLNYLMENGTDPRDGSGALATSHFRDARKKVYLLKSFRQMVIAKLASSQQP